MFISVYIHGIKNLTRDIGIILLNPEKKRLRSGGHGTTNAGSGFSKKRSTKRKTFGLRMWRNGAFRSYMQVSWLISAPATLIIISVLTFLEAKTAGHYTHALMGTCVFLIFIVAGFCYSFFYKKIPLKKIFLHSKLWRPLNRRDRRGVYRTTRQNRSKTGTSSVTKETEATTTRNEDSTDKREEAENGQVGEEKKIEGKEEPGKLSHPVRVLK